MTHILLPSRVVVSPKATFTALRANPSEGGPISGGPSGRILSMSRRDEDWFWAVGADLQRAVSEFRPRLAHGRSWEPRIDLLEDDRHFVIRAEIAGVRGEDIHLQYTPERHALILRGHRPEPETTQDDHVGFYQLEIYYGDFYREIRLPDVAVDPDGIKAQYRNGFLLILVPKRERTNIPVLDESCPT